MNSAVASSPRLRALADLCQVFQQRTDPALNGARRDPNLFMPYVIRDEHGQAIRQELCHRSLQEHFNQHSYALGSVARDHGKTTQISVGRVAYEIGRNPNIRVKVVCAKDSPATLRVKAVASVLRSPAYRRVFPKVKLVSQGDTQLFVEREGSSPEPTLDGYGVMSSVTGGRTDLLVLDDVVDAEQAVSSTKRQKVYKRIVDDWLNTVEPTGRVWGIYTPWHVSDAMALLEQNAMWAKFYLSVKDGPIWPTKWSEDALAKQKALIGASSYARGYELRRMADEDVILKPESWSFYDTEPSFDYVAVGCDLAISESDTACYTALVAVGKQSHRAYPFAAARGRWSFPEQIRRAVEFCQLVKANVIYVESIAYQKALSQALLTMDLPFGVASVEAKKDKVTCAHDLAVLVETGRVLYPGSKESPRLPWLWEECTQFPFGDTCDGLDALEHAVHGVFRGGMSQDWGGRVETVEEPTPFEVGAPYDG